MVSTHSRPKAAGAFRTVLGTEQQVSTHSRPKAAGYLMFCNRFFFVCFNTQPPEGGWMPFEHQSVIILKFQHTAARRRLEILLCRTHWSLMFQHTAARRRLETNRYIGNLMVSFNTQPPEGGWLCTSSLACIMKMFQHTAARRRLGVGITIEGMNCIVSTHSRPKAAGASCYR